MTDRIKNRRGVLRAVGLATLGTLAGCTGGGSDGGTGRETPTGATTGTTAGQGGSKTETTTAGTTETTIESTTETTTESTTTTTTETTATGGTGFLPRRAKLAADDGDSEDYFGHSVALSADATTALVGASTDEDPGARNAGAVYVFERANGQWTLETKLAAEDGDRGDEFGGAVALSGAGDTALVGASLDEEPAGELAGAAYVFERTGSGWDQRAKLAGDGVDEDDGFGDSVELSADGTVALVGAPGDEDPNGKRGGSAYVFERGTGNWRRAAKLAAEDGDGEDYFGFSVALSGAGDTALVGAYTDEDPNGEVAGSAYVFSRGGGGDWSQQAKLAADDGDSEDPDDGDAEDWFGSSVALSGSTALVGAAQDEDPNDSNMGSAYVFERTGGT